MDYRLQGKGVTRAAPERVQHVQRGGNFGGNFRSCGMETRANRAFPAQI